jgi:hypothetical protein
MCRFTVMRVRGQCSRRAACRPESRQGLPQQEYDVEAAATLAKRNGFEVVGPQLAYRAP